MENYKTQEALEIDLKKIQKVKLAETENQKDLKSLKDLLDSTDPFFNIRHQEELNQAEESMVNYLCRKVLIEQFEINPDAIEVEQSTLDMDQLLDVATEAIKLKLHGQLDHDGKNAEWLLPSNRRA